MHFFITHNQLPTQDVVDSFGPDSALPTSKFNVTSRFQLTSQVKAFACQDSLMIVQQSSVDSALVNVILKPIERLKIPFDTVQYYIYRGLTRDSFFVGNEIIPETTTDKTELLTRVWSEYSDFIAKHPSVIVDQLKPYDFGYENILSDSLLIEKVYDNSQTNVRAIFVKEGEWIGNFAFQNSVANPIKIGFEVIIEAEKFALDLNYVRAEKYQIDVAGLSGLDLKSKREYILSFIDPVAFFGLHFDVGVSFTEYNPNKTTNKTKTDPQAPNYIYITLLNKFATKNRVYLDIRSEKGYSYNFYQNYGNENSNNIKIGNSNQVPIEQTYSVNDWPIIFIDATLNTTETNNNIKINLRIDDNIKPILFFRNTKLLGNKNFTRFIDDTEMLNGTATDWSKDLTFTFPNTGTGASKENVAYYIKLQYFRQGKGLYLDLLSDIELTTINNQLDSIGTNSSLFRKVINTLKSSTNLFVVKIDATLATEGSFIPDKNSQGGVITFRNNEIINNPFFLIEEIFHAYQNEIKYAVYDLDFKINLEFEAKVFKILVNLEANIPSITYPEMVEIENFIIQSYTVIPTFEQIQSEVFRNKYQEEAIAFANYHISIGTTNPQYTILNEQAPKGIESTYR